MQFVMVNNFTYVKFFDKTKNKGRNFHANF